MMLIKFIKNCFVLYRYRDTLKLASEIFNRPNSILTTKAIENLTGEEMEGITDLERVNRILNLKPTILATELKRLEEGFRNRE